MTLNMSDKLKKKTDRLRVTFVEKVFVLIAVTAASAAFFSAGSVVLKTLLHN